VASQCEPPGPVLEASVRRLAAQQRNHKKLKRELAEEEAKARARL